MGNRKMLYIPEIVPHSFVFFYYEGSSGKKYSIRDYSGGGTPRLYYGHTLPYTAEQILDTCRFQFNAEAIDTHDIRYWKGQTDWYNDRYLKHMPAPVPIKANAVVSSPTLETSPVRLPHSKYPILNLPQLCSHPVKGAKGQDLERILTSPVSEDYVTWNMVQLLKRRSPTGWWPEVLMAARADNPQFSLNTAPDDLPQIDLWQKIPAPVEYEKLSRERMAKSRNPQWVQRSQDGKPVEGPSEIDLVMRGREYLIFIEAKLDSDISLNTTYDPGRNQIVRNIDVLLEVCGYRTPVFWMIAKDRGPGRTYTQVIKQYRKEPPRLFQDLPHRDPKILEKVASNLSIILWRDIFPLVSCEGGEAVYQEINRRI